MNKDWDWFLVMAVGFGLGMMLWLLPLFGA